MNCARRSLRIRSWRNMKAGLWFCAFVAVLAGCVTAKVDYGLGRVKASQNSKFANMPVTLKIIDKRYADKQTVSSYAHKKGSYNRGLVFPVTLKDYNEIFGNRAEKAEDGWYIAPDRLYWTPSGPVESMGARLGEHLKKARNFATVTVAPPATADVGWRAQSGVTLTLTLERLIALKERRAGVDTFGFFGISAIADSAEIIAACAEWRLEDVNGMEITKGKIDFCERTRGNSWRAKNKPFALVNRVAQRMGDELVSKCR